jgi:hypothetical protein
VSDCRIISKLTGFFGSPIRSLMAPIRVAQTDRQAGVPTVPLEPAYLATDGTYVAIDPDKTGTDYVVCHGDTLDDILASTRFDSRRHFIYCRFDGKWERLFWAYGIDERGTPHDLYRRINK